MFTFLLKLLLPHICTSALYLCVFLNKQSYLCNNFKSHLKLNNERAIHFNTLRYICYKEKYLFIFFLVFLILHKFWHILISSLWRSQGRTVEIAPAIIIFFIFLFLFLLMSFVRRSPPRPLHGGFLQIRCHMKGPMRSGAISNFYCPNWPNF